MMVNNADWKKSGEGTYDAYGNLCCRVWRQWSLVVGFPLPPRG